MIETPLTCNPSSINISTGTQFNLLYPAVHVLRQYKLSTVMGVTTAVCSVLLCVVKLAFTVHGESFQCSVDRNHKLTSFSGESVYLSLPCNHRLADFTCGDYRVQVTLGNGKVAKNLSPVTMWVKIVNSQTENIFQTRTSQIVLRDYHAGRTKDAWKDKLGSLDDLDLIGYDKSRKRLVLKKSGIFDVEFSKGGDVAVMCHANMVEFKSRPLPETLCGTGLAGTKELEEGFARLFGEIYLATADDFVNYIVLSDTTVKQSKTCRALIDNVIRCESMKKAVAQCDVILRDVILSQCLAKSGMDLEKYFNDCFISVCFDDDSPMDTMNNYIDDNCEGVSPVCTTEI
ncbi:uncharacterized protein [Littorina saxatilis]|uniref:uncharacterized protein isoform X2 n=1 Tax=Littorina saxatilis TaxID=31220 RepID=UPI0038B4B1E5